MPVTWLTDDRPMTWWTRVYTGVMWAMRDKRAFEGADHTRAVARERQRRGDAPPTRWTRLTTRVTARPWRDRRLWVVAPRRGATTAQVAYLHGGGYVHPLTKDYWRLVRRLARAGAQVVVPAYPLAPGVTIDDVLPDLVDLVADLGRPPGSVVLMGDSAGGALALVVAARLRDLGRPAPAGVVAISPWLDATLSQPEVSDHEATDPMLAESGLRAAGRWWAGPRSPEDPTVSPVSLPLDGLPPVDVLIGDRDILRPAVDELARRAEHAEVDLTVRETTAMFHVWVTRAVPEARRARRQLVELVRSRVDPARAGRAGR